MNFLWNVKDFRFFHNICLLTLVDWRKSKFTFMINFTLNKTRYKIKQLPMEFAIIKYHKN